ncbi:HTH-type transcriptional regulator CynR [Lacunisphaera limnophila]|uniref:HTH-type transcriptional regulator CynR n=1 Tax=Lacunisphaera limnophila TaxID=1838286 RepID=A0A1D8AVX0_9BACT|nr:LysR family transcriptional regulator [Lacunisphaera limnophila]AOS45039.1 HTH-type transcriptional regulator CynR [Lacunisphaera limnophila]
MEIYQLRYFLAVAETGNFTKAAGRVFVSQPSLSQQILNLEEEVGQKLFHRMARKVVLTDAGLKLLETARRVLSEVDQTLQELKESTGLGPKVAVGAIPTVASFFFPAVIAHCRANEIPLVIQTQEDFRRPLTEAVLEGHLDWALISVPFNEPRLHFEKLYSEPLWVAMSAHHRLAQVGNLTFDALRDENFILLGEASTLTLQIQHFCGDADFEPRISHRCGQLATAKSLTALGLGITVLPRSARSATDPEGLIFRKFSGPVQPSRDIALVRHRRRHLGRGAQVFADVARAVVGPIASTTTSAPFKSGS